MKKKTEEINKNDQVLKIWEDEMTMSYKYRIIKERINL